MKKKNERLYEGLFADKIIEDGNIEMFSIYDFPNLYELTAFIEECERQNCFVKFENEDIVISNTQESDKHLANHMKMIIAFSIVQDPRYLQNYRRYLKTKGHPLTQSRTNDSKS